MLSEWQSLSPAFYKHKLRPNWKGSGQLGLLLEVCYTPIPHATTKCTNVNRNKGVGWCTPTSMGCFSVRSFSVFLSLSSCQLHKSTLATIKIRSLLCTLQVALHNVLHIFIQTVQGYRSKEPQKCCLWSINQGNASEKHSSEEQNAAWVFQPLL